MNKIRIITILVASFGLFTSAMSQIGVDPLKISFTDNAEINYGLDGFLGPQAIKIKNLDSYQVGTGTFPFTVFGRLQFDSYGHQFMTDGVLNLEVSSLGKVFRPASNLADLLPYAYGTILVTPGVVTIQNDTGNFTATASGSTVTITFTDASINTDNMVVNITPVATDIVSPSQVMMDPLSNNQVNVFLFTADGSGSISNYGINIMAYRP